MKTLFITLGLLMLAATIFDFALSSHHYKGGWTTDNTIWFATRLVFGLTTVILLVVSPLL